MKYGKPKAQVVGLNSLNMQGRAAASGSPPILLRTRENIFTPDELAILEQLSDLELIQRHTQGQTLLGLIEHPSILNLTKQEKATLKSNLQDQMQVIRGIIRSRQLANGAGQAEPDPAGG